MKIFSTAHYDIHFISNTNKKEYTEQGGVNYTHDIETQFQIVNKLLGTVEQVTGNLPHAIYYATSLTDSMRDVIKGKFEGSFVKELMEPMIGKPTLVVDNTNPLTSAENYVEQDTNI